MREKSEVFIDSPSKYRNITSEQYFHSNRNQRLYGLVGLAFGRSLSACLLHIRSAIVALMEQLGGIDNINLMELYHILDESSLVLEKLAVFCCCVSYKIHCIITV